MDSHTHSRGPLRRLLRFMVDRAKALKLGRLLRPLLRHLPQRVQIRVNRLNQRLFVQSGHHVLVPEHELERSYQDALNLLIEQHGPQALGDYLEFGVAFGTSLACMYRSCKALSIEDMRFIGFDSFQGLPPATALDDEGVWSMGQFACDIALTKQLLARRGVSLDRVILVEGWFEDTLNDTPIQQFAITRASVIMIDCDMYQSAKQALTFCGPLIQDVAIVFFDDWHAGDLAARNMGEKRAFDEFLDENPQFASENVPQLSNYTAFAEVFLVRRLP
jgi:O-methyltransferase